MIRHNLWSFQSVILSNSLCHSVFFYFFHLNDFSVLHINFHISISHVFQYCLQLFNIYAVQNWFLCFLRHGAAPPFLVAQAVLHTFLIGIVCFLGLDYTLIKYSCQYQSFINLKINIKGDFSKSIDLEFGSSATMSIEIERRS